MVTLGEVDSHAIAEVFWKLPNGFVSSASCTLCLSANIWELEVL